MSKKILTIPVFIGLFFSLIFLFNNTTEKHPLKPEVKSSFSPKSSVQMKRARDEYFFNLLRDPATNRIPENIRRKELDFAEFVKGMNSLNKTNVLQWQEAGPNDVGGRTRALGVDITNPNIIIAGGISGGIWKSTDKGQTWKMKSSSTQMLSVTSLAQDRRAGNTNTWYYTTGEYSGNSASDRGYTATFYGGGVYKSIDNGETWNLLESTSSVDPTSWDGNFDLASKVVVNPATGSVFVAANAIGIFRSANVGGSFNLSLGGVNEHIFSDVAAGSNGTLVAVISAPFQGVTPKNKPGIYKSTDDGNTWISITPQSMPASFERTVLALAPSNENVLYAYSNSGSKNGDKEIVKFYKINVSTGAAEDRSANMPDFGQNYNDFINTQGNYNMVIAVQPDNENVVVMGASSMFRSMNGFATKPNELRIGLIGGYYPEAPWRYPNLHPDVHSFAFDPQTPSALWVGHDGGLSYTDNISNTVYNKHLPWVNKNNSYNITQYYMITIPDIPGDNRIMGGCQDNGTPFFTFNGTTTSASVDVSGGDGSYAYFGNNYAYTSSQSGWVLRVNYDNGTPDDSKGWSLVYPKGAKDQLFINPFAVDPNNENVMYYPAGAKLWRNTQLNSIPLYESEGTTVGWSELTNVNIPSGYLISTLAVSKNPAHVLYIAASSFQSSPKIYRLDNSATSNSSPTEVSIPGAAAGSYIHGIAVNPDNSNEILVVFSNYNVVGLYHSNNGGQSYEAVEGNLTGSQQKPGPSLRSATILPSGNGTNYFVATSIGVFSTSQLNGNNTTWNQEGANTIGNVVVSYITSRKSDGKVVAGTHGRGAFIANLSGGAGNAIASVNVQNLSISVKPGETAYSGFNLSNIGSANLNYNITASGKNNSPSTADGIMKVYKDPVKGKITSIGNQVVRELTRANKPPIGPVRNPEEVNGTDILLLDDGNAAPDDYLGVNGGNFGWANEFELNKDFSMDSFLFYMQTGAALSNQVYLAVINSNFAVLAEATLDLSLAATGDWFQITLNNPINFTSGSKFYILVQTNGSGIPYPAGIDFQAQVTGKSYYSDGSSLINLNTTQFTNAAFLIRASGTLGGGSANQSPNAIAQLSKTTAQVNEAITFDASQSSDPDGQVVSYLWNFGDGNSSTSKTVSHSFSQANTYNYALTVTDDKGATGTTNGQVVITGGTPEKRLIVSPQSGTISPGSSVNVSVSFNAAGLAEGTYQEQLTISGNGGSITIPIAILVSNTVDVSSQDGIPKTYYVDQNYPNPFNPSTRIKYGLPLQSHVIIRIYDTNGKQITELLNREQSAGTYNAEWNGKNNYGTQVSSGIYLYSIQAGSFSETRKMILLK